MRLFVFAFLAIAALAAEQSPAPKGSKPKPAAVTVPTDATEIAPHVWRHTDKAGKTWIYRETPFGLSKVEERVPDAAAMAAQPTNVVPVKVTEDGDTIRFEKPTPMGNRVWTKKRAELTPEEKDWLEKTKASPARDKTAEK